MSLLFITDDLIQKALRDLYRGNRFFGIIYNHFSYDMVEYARNITPREIWNMEEERDLMATHLLFILESYIPSDCKKVEVRRRINNE